MRYYTLLDGTRNALEAAAVVNEERSLFGAWEPFWRPAKPELGGYSMGPEKSSLPEIESQGRDSLASELSRLFTAVQSPSMSLAIGLDDPVGELRTVISSDY